MPSCGMLSISDSIPVCFPRKKMNSLMGDIKVELAAKRERLRELHQEQIQTINFIRDLKGQKAALEQLTTSARKSKETRHKQDSGMTVDEQIAKEEMKAQKITDEIDALEMAISLLEE